MKYGAKPANIDCVPSVHYGPLFFNKRFIGVLFGTSTTWLVHKEVGQDRILNLEQLFAVTFAQFIWWAHLELWLVATRGVLAKVAKHKL